MGSVDVNLCRKCRGAWVALAPAGPHSRNWRARIDEFIGCKGVSEWANTRREPSSQVHAVRWTREMKMKRVWIAGLAVVAVTRLRVRGSEARLPRSGLFGTLDLE